ncbi:MAG: sensor histidine kinase [Caldilineaceae bacterium]|nr:sensor histidine kinase [Caldilineaceae bacterium]HRJ40563.1 sensor histidine kinase [Caldilineaceae bacterium]
MFLRANTITQVSLLCLMGFLLYSLRLTAVRNRLESRHSVWFFIAALGLGMGTIFVTLVADVVEGPWGYFAIYFRALFATYFYYQILLFLYALPPASPTDQREIHILATAIRPLLVAEVLYLLYRTIRLLETGTYIQRPTLIETPVIILVLWAAFLSIRRLLAAESAETPDVSRRFLRCGPARYLQFLINSLLRPRSRVTRVYRWFTLTIFALIFLVFVFTLLPYRQLPLWVDMGLDASLTIGVTVTVLVYLRYQLVPISLEMRVIGAGLTLFLLLCHSLAWSISLIYLDQKLPGIPYAHILGSAQQPDFAIAMAYRETARGLSELLFAIICFQIGGTLVFGLLSAVYYRGTLINALSVLLTGFEQAERGNLAYRIPPLEWQDEFGRIAAAFNHMAESLEASRQAVLHYQEGLEDLIEERTAALAEEIALRKDGELRQAIQEERARISRETHDGLLQSLAGVRLRLLRGRRLSGQGPEVIQAEMAELAQEVTGAGQELRRLINDLNGEILRDGLITSIERIVERHRRSYEISIQTHFSYEPGVLSLSQELNLLRIAQEALSNACRHSQADEVILQLQVSGDGEEPCTRLLVDDNGQGFDPQNLKRRGRGLVNLQRRAAEMDARLTIQSRPGRGTTVGVVFA